MNQEKEAYINASREVDMGGQDKGLWIKALSITKGDEALARHEYVKIRVEELLREAGIPSFEQTTEQPISLIDRATTPENRRWLYRLILYIGLVAGITPILLNEPETPFSSLFTICSVIVGVRFLLAGKRVRFTTALVLAGLLNPWLLEENKYEEGLCYFISACCTTLLLILHSQPKHYKLFRNVTFALSGLFYMMLLIFWGPVESWEVGVFFELLEDSPLIPVTLFLLIGLPLVKNTVFAARHSSV